MCIQVIFSAILTYHNCTSEKVKTQLEDLTSEFNLLATQLLKYFTYNKLGSFQRLFLSCNLFIFFLYASTYSSSCYCGFDPGHRKAGIPRLH